MDVELTIIKDIISILDSSVDYKHYSNEKVSDFIEYAAGLWADEQKLIAPILFPKFLEKILGFKLGETVGTEEATLESRDTPDYIPTDTRTHPYVFDCKGMDTIDLSNHYPQIKRYLESQSVKYGILVNMRNLSVFTLDSSAEIENFKISFVDLYKDFKDNPTNVLEKENTKHFLHFIESFQYTPLSLEQKFKRVVDAKQWTGNELLNINVLTKRLHFVVERIYEDVALRKNELLTLKEVEPERVKAIIQEIEMIVTEIGQEKQNENEGEKVHTFDEILNASSQSIFKKALDVYFYRIGYFTMTRILLVRAWEDIGFVDQTLYNGGLAKWYMNFNKEIKRVLVYTFELAAERYRWLFNVENNYTWYDPSDTTLIEVLYDLTPQNQSNINVRLIKK